SVEDFKTIVEMYDKLTKLNLDSERFVMMRKVDKKFTGIKFTEFRESIRNFANGLASLGIKRGDMVGIVAENRPEWSYSDLAILSIGAVDVPMYPSSTASTIEYILNDSGCKAVVVSNKLQLSKVQKIKDNVKSLKYIIIMNETDAGDGILSMNEVMEEGKDFARSNPNFLDEEISKAKPEELCTLIYTSGTTGEPKGVMLTHNNFVTNIRAAKQCISIGETDIFLSFLPLSHSFERMAGYYTALSSGGMICYAESIDTVAENMLEIKPTIMTSVPRLFERIHAKVMKNVDASPPKKQKIFYWAIETGKKYQESKKKKKLSPFLAAKYKLADILVFKKIKARTGGRLRFFVSGGAALPQNIGEFFDALGIIIVEGYGLTESSPVITCNRLDDYKFGTVGKPIPGVEVKIAGDGEIFARGPNIMKGYYNNKKATEEAVDKDGWLHTGDIGEFDKQGFIRITDRKKHLFKTSGGEYIAPQPLEDIFTRSKFIDQFVLIGDNKTYLSALITPDFEALKEYADSHNIPYSKVDELTKSTEIYQIIEKDIATLQRNLANYERIRKFIILEKPFSIEGGELTPTLKVKRKLVEERYADLINGMYEK
ncbi:MAG: long-chain fatty acid--CoA ligase, partial [Bacteroidetes bacterium]|nr:long-chain fatty acid--CoA ligase [Bacteroidota bacterium]